MGMKRHFFTGLWTASAVLLIWFGALPVRAQAAAPWPLTRLDSVASVRMPYAGSMNDGEEGEALAAIGLRMYSAPTSDNQFAVVVYTPKPAKELKPGYTLVINPDRIIAALLRIPDKQFSKARLRASYPVALPTAPGGQGTHQVYSGFDDFHQLPAKMELTWVIVGPTLYIFSAAYSLPQEKDGAEDLQHFFSTIGFQPTP